MNNLTTPPPVQELDPQYVEDLRAELVRTAHGTHRQRSVWTPVLAAACGVAVITGGVVAGTRTVGSSDPAGSPAPPTPTSTVAQKVPDGGSERVNLDLGPAYGPATIEVAKRCLANKTSALGEPNTARPADVDAPASHTANWVKALPGDGGHTRPVVAKHLVQTITTQAGVRVQCRDAELLQSFDPANAGGLSFVKSRNLDPATPLNGQWTFEEIHEGKLPLLFVDFSFSAWPTVDRVELRIRWTGGASPWYGVRAIDGSGYVEASQYGAIHDRRATEVDYRAIDRNGRVIFSGVEYG
jgi:hypothetical protein